MSIKLHQFDIKGAAEPVRVAFSIGGIPFEDLRYTKDTWPEMKPKTPLGQLPVLEIDGKMQTQSRAILRQAGVKSGLYPTDTVKAMRVDELIDVYQDMYMHIGATMKLEGEEKKKAREGLYDLFKPILTKIEEMLKEYDGPFCTGTELTIADIFWQGRLEQLSSDTLDDFKKDFMESHPGIKAWYEACCEHPGIKAQYKK